MKIFINLDILDEVPKSGKKRTQILDFIKSLAEDPTNSGDYFEEDEVGRALYTKVVGDFAITYWPDTLVKEVKIVRVGKADISGN